LIEVTRSERWEGDLFARGGYATSVGLKAQISA